MKDVNIVNVPFWLVFLLVLGVFSNVFILSKVSQKPKAYQKIEFIRTPNGTPCIVVKTQSGVGLSCKHNQPPHGKVGNLGE